MKRITWVDNFKYFCIIAVIAEHTECMTGITDAINSSFYLVGFFFASGYIYSHKETFPVFIKNKTRQLFIPWLFFSLLIILSTGIFSFYDHGNIKDNLINNFLQIRYKGDEMWFVAALFVSYIPFYFLIRWTGKSYKKLITVIILALIISIPFFIIDETYFINGKQYHYLWHIEHIPAGVLFLLLGYSFHNYWEFSFDSFFNVFSRKAALWVIYLGYILIPQLLHIQFSNILYVIYRYISYFLGLCTFILLSKSINYSRYLSFVGRNTIIYYGLHGKIHSLLHYVLYTYAGEPYRALCWSNTDSLRLLLLATVSSYVIAIIISFLLIVPTYIIENYLPFVVGKRSKLKH